MKPSSIIHNDITYTKRSLDTGRAVAQFITKHGLENRVFLASSDPVKTWAAKQENPNLVIGSTFLNSYWKQNSAWYNDLKCQLKLLPGLKTCLDYLPTDKTMMNVLLLNASISKSVNDLFLDIEFEMFGEDTIDALKVDILRKNYNNGTASLGSFTIYDMKMNETEIQKTEPIVESLMKQHFERLFTDNVTRLREKLGRHKKPTTTSAPTTQSTTPDFITNPTTIPATIPGPNPIPWPTKSTKSDAANKCVWPVLSFIPLLVTFSFG